MEGGRVIIALDHIVSVMQHTKMYIHVYRHIYTCTCTCTLCSYHDLFHPPGCIFGFIEFHKCKTARACIHTRRKEIKTTEINNTHATMNIMYIVHVHVNVHKHVHVQYMDMYTNNTL